MTIAHNQGRTNPLASRHRVLAASVWLAWMWLAWMWLALVALVPAAAAQSGADPPSPSGLPRSSGTAPFTASNDTPVPIVAEPRIGPADPNATRLFFAPTGRSLPRGHGYAGVYQVLMPFLQYGVTDRLSLGGGTPLVFGGGSGRPIWLTPKVQLHASARVQAAAGVMHVLNVEGHAGVAYGVVTVGSGHRAISAGAGWGYTRTDENHGGTLMVMIAAEHRASRRVKWITENYVLQGGGLVTGGVRLIGDRLSTDIALAAPVGTSGLFVWPLVNFVWTF